MATLTTERCPTARSTRNGNIEGKSSIEDSTLTSNEPKRLASLYGFMREFPRPIQTLSFWSDDKHAAKSEQGQQVPALTPIENQGSKEHPAHEEVSKPSFEQQNNLNVSEQHDSTLANGKAQDDEPLSTNSTVQLSHQQESQEALPSDALSLQPSFRTDDSKKSGVQQDMLETPVGTNCSLSTKSVIALLGNHPNDRQENAILGREGERGEIDATIETPEAITAEDHQRLDAEIETSHKVRLASEREDENQKGKKMPTREASEGDIVARNIAEIQRAVTISADQSMSTWPFAIEVDTQAKGRAASELAGKGKSVITTKVSGPSSQKEVRAFSERGKNLYEATRLRPDKSLLSQWKSSGRQLIDKRLRDLHLGQNVITNLRLCMLGPTPDEKSMKPTILIVCSDEKRIKKVNNGLREFIKVSFPDCVEFKIIPGNVKLASGSGYSQTSTQRSELMFNLEVIVPSESYSTVVGKRMRITKPQASPSQFMGSSTATIGGIVTVGNSVYGLTVAHSLFENAAESYTPGQIKACGWVESYEWSGCEKLRSRDASVGMDWMLIRLREEFILPNQYFASEDEPPQPISGFVQNVELPDDEVWICSGFTQPQIGILDPTSSSIILDQVSYEVLSIALEFPLAAGDSGSWVLRDSKVCGYIFGRLDEEPWAYMLPIEPVFDEISRCMSRESKLKVDVSDAATIETLKRNNSKQGPVDERRETDRPSLSSITSIHEPNADQCTTSTFTAHKNSPVLMDESDEEDRRSTPSSVRIQDGRNLFPLIAAEETWSPWIQSRDSSRRHSRSFIPRYFLSPTRPKNKSHDFEHLPRGRLSSAWRRILGSDVPDTTKARSSLDECSNYDEDAFLSSSYDPLSRFDSETSLLSRKKSTVLKRQLQYGRVGLREYCTITTVIMYAIILVIPASCISTIFWAGFTHLTPLEKAFGILVPSLVLIVFGILVWFVCKEIRKERRRRRLGRYDNFHRRPLINVRGLLGDT